MKHRILVFTVHKAASLGVYEVMRQVARKEGWPFHSANLKKPNLVEPKAPGDPDFYKQLDGKTGLVGPVRMPVTLSADALERDHFILHLRDPRDVLVSMFYSWSYSHPGVSDEYRESLREKGVDNFVLQNSAGLKSKYELYIRDFISQHQTMVLKYETFVLSRPEWLGQFLEAVGIGDKMNRYAQLAKNNPAEKVTTENIHAHIRKAAPGDYREKLTLETRRMLNHEWRDILRVLDYTKE
jgi:Sulfotransferase domain